MDRMANLLPEYLLITGRVVSIEVAPPAEMGASFPKNRTIKGAPRRVMISLMMFTRRATVPISIPLYWVINMLDSE